MKLKKLLVLAFLALTLIPIGVVSLLLYESGYNLSKESYIRNLKESITVQEDYIAQSIDNNKIADYRFVNRNRNLFTFDDTTQNFQQNGLFAAFQNYLETSEDKITVCLLLNKENKPVYSIGEKGVRDTVIAQLPPLNNLKNQTIIEFELEKNGYSLGVITPITKPDGTYEGCFVSVYSKYYIFKIISSYYKIADTSTYICQKNGDIITFQKFADENQNTAIQHALDALTLGSEALIDMRIGGTPVLGYYKKIHNTPWYLVGFIDDSLIADFTNHYVWVYFFIIIGVCLADIILAFYFSQRTVKPINNLIKVMDAYQSGKSSNIPTTDKENSYFEIQYLWKKFSDLMKTVMLVQHNFESIYQLYQSSNMGDINIDIDVKKQTIASNKEVFQTLMHELDVAPEACIVERFVQCFCEKDKLVLLDILEKMRDEHLSVACEAEVYTPYLNQKWFHSLIVPLYEDDRLARFFVQLRDISSFKKQEFESIEQARRDPLTGLYNRSGFTEYVNKALRQPDAQKPHGLLFLDMDFFKLVNDNLGHSAGDDLLRSISGSLREIISDRGIAARLGGDEFAVFLPHTDRETIDEVKTELRKRLVYPFQTNTLSFTVSTSIGVAVWQSDSPATLEELLRQADEDMYQAKKEFKQSLKDA